MVLDMSDTTRVLPRLPKAQCDVCGKPSTHVAIDVQFGGHDEKGNAFWTKKGPLKSGCADC